MIGDVYRYNEIKRNGTDGVSAVGQDKIEYTYRQKKDREFLRSLSYFLDQHCICAHKHEFGEVFADAKVKLLCEPPKLDYARFRKPHCSEVRANARVKLSLPALPKAKLHYPQDNFTYTVNFTCP